MRRHPLRSALLASLAWALPAVAAGPSAPRALFDAGYPGVALAGPDVTITAYRGGVLSRVLVGLGERVSRGQLLAVLEDEAAQQRVRLAEVALEAAAASRERARADLDLAERRLARREQARDMVSLEEIEAAREQRSLARAALARAESDRERARLELEQAKRDLAALSLRSPIDGVVAERLADPGELLPAGAAVLRLAGRGPRSVRFAVPPDAARTLSIGDPVRVVLEDGAGPSVRAVIRRIAPEIDEASGLLFVEAEVDSAAAEGRARLWGGLLRVFPSDR